MREPDISGSRSPTLQSAAHQLMIVRFDTFIASAISIGANAEIFRIQFNAMITGITYEFLVLN